MIRNFSAITYDRWSHFAKSSRAVAIMFVWAFAEAIWWPVIPDGLLVPLAIGARRRFWVVLLASVLGSALGGTLLYLLLYSSPVSYLERP